MSITITIAVYTFNRLETISHIIRRISLIKSEIKKLIIVVDRNQKLLDHLIQKFGSLDFIDIIPNRGVGLSEARNTAIYRSKSLYIAFLDDDAIPSWSWLNFVSYGLYTEYQAMGGPVIPLYPIGYKEKIPKTLRWLYGCTFPPTFHHHKRMKIRNPIGANMIFRIADLKSVNGFGQKFGRDRDKLFTGDETHVSQNLAKLGISINFLPDLLVHHLVPPSRLTVQYTARRAYFEGYSKSLMQKNQSAKITGVEENYLKWLIANFYGFSLLQLINVIIVIFFTGVGYIRGKSIS